MNYFDHYRSIPPHGASTMWRKKVLQNLGGYREDLRAQDGLDIWLRGKSRQSFSHVSLPLFYYRKHNFNLTNSKQLISKARSRIKLDAAIAAGPKPNISAIIPCRSRFDFTPNLWNLEIAKKSLLRYALDSCLASPLIDRVYVLGDTDEIKTEVEKIKSQIKDSIPITFVHRPIYDTREYVPLVNALKNFIETDDSLADGIFLVRHLHAPFVSSQEITELLSNLILEESTSAALVSKLDWTILSRNRFGLQVVYERNFITTSMDSFYQYRNSAMATFASNLKKSSLWGASTSFIESNSAGQFIIDSHNKIDMASIFSNDASNA
jgi:CMP-N-acetylneuraminic acid synthetase